jgi:hypothetical protein
MSHTGPNNARILLKFPENIIHSIFLKCVAVEDVVSVVGAFLSSKFLSGICSCTNSVKKSLSSVFLFSNVDVVVDNVDCDKDVVCSFFSDVSVVAVVVVAADVVDFKVISKNYINILNFFFRLFCHSLKDQVFLKTIY